MRWGRATSATTVSGAWARFAASSNPSGPGVVWPRLASSGGSYLSLNTPISVGWAMKQHRCAFWSAARWSSADTLPA